MKMQLPLLLGILTLIAGCVSPPVFVEIPPVSPKLIKVELQVVHVQNDDIAILGSASVLTVPGVRGLIEKKAATVTHTLVITTANGDEAEVRGVTEWIYPTEFEPLSEPREPQRVSVEVSVTGAVVTPSSFETREVGSIISILPIVLESGNVQLQISPHLLKEPTWHSYNGGGQPTKSTDGVSQPFFDKISLSATAIMKDGEPLILAAFPSRGDKTQTTVVMVNAHILN